MHAYRMPRKRASPHPTSLISAYMLRTKLKEALAQHIAAPLDSATKADALVNAMITQALEDPKTATHLFKLVTGDAEEAEPIEKSSKQDWESLFAFFGKYKPLIEQEIERLQATNPGYWSFEWFSPTLESAPWYHDIHQSL